VYKLDNSFAENRFMVTVVGCGGTGGFTAEGLCRLLPARAGLLLIDPDRVEERNLTRQNFCRQDLGKFKSEALALRLAGRYERAIAYSTLPLALTEVKVPGLVIGCVDNGPARGEIAKSSKDRLYTSYTRPSWWIDAGNGESYGQVLIGNTDRGAIYDSDKETFSALPFPTLQRPELLSQAPPREQGCAQVAEQGPTINQAMASVVVEVVRRLIEGNCHWVQLYLDLEAGTLHPVLATLETLQKIMGIKIRK